MVLMSVFQFETKFNVYDVNLIFMSYFFILWLVSSYINHYCFMLETTYYCYNEKRLTLDYCLKNSLGLQFPFSTKESTL